MVADCVIAIDVATGEQPPGIGNSRAFLVENVVAQFLRLTHFGGSLRQPDFKRADATQGLRRSMCACGPRLQSTIGLQRRNNATDAKTTWSRPKALKQTALGIESCAGGHRLGPFGVDARKPYVWRHS